MTTQLTPGKWRGMGRMADDRGCFKMMAVDQRPPIKNPIAAHYGTDEAPYDDVARFKALLIETLQPDATAVLLDPHYAIPRGIHLLAPGKGLVVTLEDSVFRETDDGRLSAEIDDWSVDKIKRMGGDAVKALVWYRPDAAPAVVAAQQDVAKRMGEACAKFDIPFLLELLVYPLAGDAHRSGEYVEMKGKNSEHVLQSVAEFAKPDYGVDVFKLESPLEADDVPGVGSDGWQEAQALFDEMGRLAGRPWVMLSAGAGKEQFRRILTHAYRAGASGFLAGRAIWLDAFKKFPDWAAMETDLRNGASSYMRDLCGLTESEALPWHEHRTYGEGGARFPFDDGAFRKGYAGMGVGP